MQAGKLGVGTVNLGQSIGLIVLIVSVYILWQIRSILLLVLAAVVLATSLNLLARRLQRSGLPRGWAVALSVGLVIALTVGTFWLLVPPFVDQLQQVVELVPAGFGQLELWLEQIRTRLPGRVIQEIPDIERLVRQLQPLVNRLVGGSLAFFSVPLTVTLNLLLVTVLTIMLLANPQPYRHVFVHLFPAFYRRRVDEILDKCEVALGGWLAGILVNMGVIATLSWVGLLVLKVPLAFAHGILAGMMTFIPNLGPALSVIPPIAIALLDSPWKALLVLILYVVIQQVESNFLTPYVMAQQVSLLPAVTLTAQIAFASFFGFLGLLLALPLTVITQVWLKEVLIKDVLDRWDHPRRRKHDLEVSTTSELITSEPVTSESIKQPESKRLADVKLPHNSNSSDSTRAS